MRDRNYPKIALEWAPESNGGTRQFYSIVIIVFILTLILASIIASVEVPPENKRRVVALPDRVAEYLSEKPKPPPLPPLPPPPPPPVKVKPKVVRKLELDDEKKPLTEVEKVAREKASESGLIALGNELADLLDSSGVDAMVKGQLNEGAGNTNASSLATSSIAAGTTDGSGGVDGEEYVGRVNTSSLSDRERTLVRQSLFKEDADGEIATAGAGAQRTSERSGRVRSEEDITMVFDQHKGALYSIYSRERRKTPGLKGKIVLELVVAPDGSVTAAKIVSSELNSSALEQRILARVRLFNFGTGEVEPVTVTFPIEFLPS